MAMIKILGKKGKNLKIVVLKDHYEWNLNRVTNDDPFEYIISLEVCLADDLDQLREQGKAIVAFYKVISTLEKILGPLGIETDVEDDEFRYYYHFLEDEVEMLFDQYHSES